MKKKKNKKKQALERSIVARVMRYDTTSEVHRSKEKIVVDPRQAPSPPPPPIFLGFLFLLLGLDPPLKSKGSRSSALNKVTERFSLG